MSSKGKFVPPKSLSIGGRVIKVKMKDDLGGPDQFCHGLYTHDDRKIEIDNETLEPVATLLHEAMHAALKTGGVSEMLGDKLEEAVCRAVELIAPNIYFKSKK